MDDSWLAVFLFVAGVAAMALLLIAVRLGTLIVLVRGIGTVAHERELREIRGNRL